jgi:signal peptidase I
VKRLFPALAAFLGLGAVGSAAFLLSTRRLVVDGRSMEPAYSEGERVLVNKLAYVRSKPRVGDVVVMRRPGEKQRLHIKRIAAAPDDEIESWGERRRLGPGEWWVLGDNPDESTDSRQLGPVRRGEIEGKVILKY